MTVTRDQGPEVEPQLRGPGKSSQMLSALARGIDARSPQLASRPEEHAPSLATDCPRTGRVWDGPRHPPPTFGVLCREVGDGRLVRGVGRQVGTARYHHVLVLVPGTAGTDAVFVGELPWAQTKECPGTRLAGEVGRRVRETNGVAHRGAHVAVRELGLASLATCRGRPCYEDAPVLLQPERWLLMSGRAEPWPTVSGVGHAVPVRGASPVIDLAPKHTPSR